MLERTRLKNVVLGDNVTIRDVALLEFEPEAPCGFGTEVAVLDERLSPGVHIPRTVGPDRVADGPRAGMV